MDISKQAGLNIRWDASRKRLLVEGRPVKPAVRRLREMKAVLADREWGRNADPRIGLYYMFRDVAKSEDKKTVRMAGIRYDITVMPPRRLGYEFVKTEGHHHPLVPNQGVTYPELYRVVHGEAVELMQKVNGRRVEDVCFVVAKEGEEVLVPPGYGHITINRSRKTLVMANWVSSRFSSMYKPIEKMGGGAFFLTAKGWKANNNYACKVRLRKKPATRPGALGLKKEEPMYSMAKSPEKLDFLNRPQLYKKLFETA